MSGTSLGRRTIDGITFSISVGSAIVVCSTIIAGAWYASSWAGDRSSDIQILQKEQRALELRYMRLDASYRQLLDSNNQTVSKQGVIAVQMDETRKSIERIEKSIERLTDIILEERRGKKPP